MMMLSLSLICSASSCERNWSMYLFMDSKVGNHLTIKKVESLVYIYSNGKLKHKKWGHNPILLYENYLEDANTKEEIKEPLSLASSKDYQGIQH